ncbi:MAG: class I SAM-dependent methyltransferase [Candidatus Nanohaloarchaeota archaeon]|nr:class I SAM-dependent methyltransferase [Candidatus Nanohaloarchaeota archaeon]
MQNAVLKDLKHTYNNIASDFSKTRQKVWDFLKEVDFSNSQTILEVGVGNFRNLAYLTAKHSFKLAVGLDFAKNFMQFKPQGIDAVIGDALTLPFKNDSFHTSLSIAVIHHFPSKELRLKALNELWRVTSNFVIVSVWSRESKKKKTGEKEADLKWKGKFSRYYYFYDYDEFKQDMLSVQPSNHKFYNDGDNLWALLYK